MQVILEAQHAVGHPKLRGVGNYAKTLIQALLSRKAFDYGLTFFDYNQEAGNRNRAELCFGEYNVPIFGCSDIDYRVASRRDDEYSKKSYNEWTHTNADVYHFMNPATIPLVLSGKMIVTIHDISWRTHPGMVAPNSVEVLSIGLQRIEEMQPFIIADSQSAKNEFLQFTEGFDEKEIEVIHPSYDEISIYPDTADISDIVEGEYILFLGAIENKKNLVRIVSAFEIIAGRNKLIKLVIAGTPSWDNSAEIYDKINSSYYKGRIITPGYINEAQKRCLYSNAICFVFPSICEGFGIPVLEAMACGCPVITANNTSLPEVGGDAAIYVDAYNTEQLAYEMERVIVHDSLRKEMRENGFEQAKKFSWDKTAEQVENVYRKVMNID